MDGMLILKQRLQRNFPMDPSKELQFIIVQDTGWFVCSKLFIDNGFVTFPKRPITLPVLKVPIHGDKKPLDVLRHCHGTLIYLRMLPHFSEEAKYHHLTFHVLWRALNAGPMHPSHKMLKHRDEDRVKSLHHHWTTTVVFFVLFKCSDT